MAAATIIDSRLPAVQGDRKVSRATLDDVADTNTWDTGLLVVEGVQCTARDASAVAADTISVASVSGGVVTFQVAGTARDAYVQAVGF